MPIRAALSSREILQLQRTVGNRSVTQLLIPRGAHGIQTKLTVGAAHDEYEEEADEVAEQVMRMPASTFSPPASGDDPRDDKQAIRRAVERRRRHPEQALGGNDYAPGAARD